MGIIADQGYINVTDDDIQRSTDILLNEQIDDGEPFSQDVREVKERAILAQASHMYTEMFGERSSRVRWANAKDLTIKDELPDLQEDPFLVADSTYGGRE